MSNKAFICNVSIISWSFKGTALNRREFYQTILSLNACIHG